MKKSFVLFASSAMALLLAGCSSDIQTDVPSPGERVVTITASIESNATKAAVSDDGILTWASGDQIGVWTSNGTTGKFTRFDLNSSDAGKVSAQFTGTLAEGYEIVAGPAVFPYREAHSYDPATQQLTYNQPSGMTFESAVTKSHMAANYSGSGSISFKHLSGLVRFTLFNVPNSVGEKGYIRLRAIEQKIHGSFVVDMSQDNPRIVTASASGIQDFNLNFNSAPADAVGKIYVANFPVPVGDYNYLRVSAQKQGGAMVFNKEKTSVTSVERAQMINMPEITYNTVELANNEGSSLRSNINNGYDNTENTSLTLAPNPGKTSFNASSNVLKIDATGQDPASSENKGGFFLIKTQNADYTNNFRNGTKAFAVKMRYADSADASIYYPQAYCNGAENESAKRLPDRINGEAFDGSAAQWAQLIKPGEWNILQWTCVNTGTWRVEITPFLSIDGNNAASGSRVIYFDDFRFLK